MYLADGRLMSFSSRRTSRWRGQGGQTYNETEGSPAADQQPGPGATGWASRPPVYVCGSWSHENVATAIAAASYWNMIKYPYAIWSVLNATATTDVPSYTTILRRTKNRSGSYSILQASADDAPYLSPSIFVSFPSLSLCLSLPSSGPRWLFCRMYGLPTVCLIVSFAECVGLSSFVLSVFVD